LGTSQTSIGTGDSEGVALAAIQGLHQLVQERDAQINAQRLELLTLKERLVQLESLRDELNVVKRTLSQLAVGNALVAVRSTP
jgi:transcriptional antiterminator